MARRDSGKLVLGGGAILAGAGIAFGGGLCLLALIQRATSRS